MGAEHQQVGIGGLELRQDLLVDVRRLLNADIDRNVRRLLGHAPHLVDQSFAIGRLENQWWKIQYGQVGEHVQQREPGFIPPGDRGRVVERML